MLVASAVRCGDRLGQHPVFLHARADPRTLVAPWCRCGCRARPPLTCLRPYHPSQATTALTSWSAQVCSCWTAACGLQLTTCHTAYHLPTPHAADARAQTLHAFLAPQQEQERVQGAGDHEPGTSSAAAAVAKATEAAAADPGSEPDDPLHAASAAAAAAAAPAARRRQAAVGAEGAPGMHDFAFMPTAMEISGAVATQQPQLRRPVRQQRNPQPGGMQGEGCTPQCVEGLLEDAERAQHAGAHCASVENGLCACVFVPTPRCLLLQALSRCSSAARTLGLQTRRWHSFRCASSQQRTHACIRCALWETCSASPTTCSSSK